MTLTITKNGRWRMVGTPDEFARFIGYTGLTEYAQEIDIKSGLANIMEGTSARFKDHRGWWELRGSRSDLAEIIGLPEAKTVAETIEAFESIHPNVKVLS